ncbi:hypothetical protein KJZ71_00265 [Patescibacteria group bacterium]|nr:hypothetical protein [Patescibacteria group bacterium]MDL1953123.1 hypothetical protein [Candidatus Uhrbacteria bacterium UHB]RIL00421.1 MAG: hypothetical protein DCC77_02545 [Candidatus Uhrbacteria bacterium]
MFAVNFRAFFAAARPGLEYTVAVAATFTLFALYPREMVLGATSGELLIVALVVISVMAGVRIQRSRPKNDGDPS